jgi:ribosome-binding protein aMBF1 (putative translation factor)
MNFSGMSFDTFRKLMDYIDTLSGGTPEPEVTEPAPEVHDEPIIPAGMDFTGGMPVHVYEKPEDMEPVKPTEDDPYAKVGNYAGKGVVVGILKDASEHPDKWEREWLTTRKWMDEKVCFPPEATLFNVAHICSDCARLGLLERRADYNVEEHKKEVRFLLPVPIKVEEKTDEELPVVTTLDARRGSKVRSARMEAGISVPELADLLHTDVNTVIKWETGVYRIAGSVEEDLKKLFGNGLFEGLEG